VDTNTRCVLAGIVGAALIPLAIVADARAILIRHDQDPQRYLADPADYPFLAEVGVAHGTLISADWILTSAHVANGVSPISGSVKIAGRSVGVKRIIYHPSWEGDLPEGFAEPSWVDLALIQLVEPLTGIKPVRLYDRFDEKGKELVFVGRGKTGDGRGEALIEDRNLRFATNIVTKAEKHLLHIRFDEPPAGMELEGIGGPGDSGGPALLREAGEFFVMGVCFRNDGQGNPDLEFKYGTNDEYVRVSTHLDWIRSVMVSKTTGCIWHDLGHEAWPQSDAGRAAQAFFEAFNSIDRARLIAFEDTWRFAEELRAMPSDTRADMWLRQARTWKTLVPRRWLLVTPGKLIVLAQSGRQWRSVRFEMQGPAPHRVRDILISREDPPADPKSGE